ncbi:MAG: hypothetical protein DCC55_22470 [Chloroflexi bacterium]|nr:MAG: hypothetical protein DCC55_22470 [Chloroflexota bacterium]
MRILSKLAAHSLITLGATIAVMTIFSLPTNTAIAIWLIFTATDLLTDYLLLTMPPRQPSIRNFFQEIQPHAHHHTHNLDSARRLDSRWVPAGPDGNDNQN